MGVAGYLGDGGNRWPAADTRDVARLYRLALESAPAGSRLHAVAEEGVALRDVAAARGRRLGVPVSSQASRDLLGWVPSRPGLIADLDGDPGLAAGADSAVTR